MRLSQPRLWPFLLISLVSATELRSSRAPIGELQLVWTSIGIDRAVLVQGSAHGDDHTALLGALQRAPETRRGVALLTHTVADTQLAAFHRKGIRAARLNWIRHLLGTRPRSEAQRLAEASALSERIAPLGWHIEIHIDAADLELLGRLVVPAGMQVVIDHMARIELSGPESEAQLNCLGEFLENPVFWVKLSGADRLAERCDDLRVALNAMRAILQFAPDRCVWGLDWPHVNLPKKRTDLALAELLFETVEDDSTLRKVLIENPARLYDFGESAP
jgi:2-pyrone-4,6-dicarboxylate lactonase